MKYLGLKSSVGLGLAVMFGFLSVAYAQNYSWTVPTTPPPSQSTTPTTTIPTQTTPTTANSTPPVFNAVATSYASASAGTAFSIPLQTYVIRSDVQTLIQQLGGSFNLGTPQISALYQLADARQRILEVQPRSSADLAEVASRDIASGNCIASRIPANIAGNIVEQIHNATFNTAERVAAYTTYRSLLSIIPNVTVSCMDQYTVSTSGIGQSIPNASSITTNTGGVVGMRTGIRPDNEITFPCTVLTQFMEYGAQNAQVLTLQRFLSDSGYMEMLPTGYFGRHTEQAVRLWQERHGVDIRGYVGPATRGSIAHVTCKGDPAKVATAERGVVASPAPASTTPAPAKPTPAPTQPATPTPEPTTTSTPPQQVIAPSQPTESPAVNYLSQTNGTFYIGRNPVNSIYFTYRVNVNNSNAYICFEKVGATNCSSTDSFRELKAQYSPGNYDAIPNGDRWIIYLHYSSAMWGGAGQGGKVYLRPSLGGAPNVFTVNVSPGV